MLVVGTWNLENLYRPGGEYGPSDDEIYAAKLKGLADTVNGLLPDLLGVQEVGEPEHSRIWSTCSTATGTLPCPRCRTGEASASGSSPGIR
jgi:hypothetical protein